MRDVAFMLREGILKMNTLELPDNLTVKDIVMGTAGIPPILDKFLQYLIGGPNSRSWSSQAKKRRIKSIGEDLVFVTLSGQKIPGKHLKLGIAVKSLTGSRLNRYGHCSNYHMIEKIDTEMTYESSESQTTTPSCMQLSPEGGIGCAFDNYDCFVETQNGKDTLHDTVGITYKVLTSTEKEPVSDPVSGKSEEIASNISDSEINMILERNIAVDVNQP